MQADWFDPVTLDGTHVRLEALSRSHAEDLWIASQDDDVWRWMPVFRPDSIDRMRAVIDDSLAERERGRLVPWAIVDRATGRAVGSTSYLDVVPEHLRIEIGWTWIGRPWWRTAINTEAKLLLLSHAFDDLGARRVSLKTDAENLRSQVSDRAPGGAAGGSTSGAHGAPRRDCSDDCVLQPALRRVAGRSPTAGRPTTRPCVWRLRRLIRSRWPMARPIQTTNAACTTTNSNRTRTILNKRSPRDAQSWT